MDSRNLETTTESPHELPRGHLGRRFRCVTGSLWRGLSAAERAIRWCGTVAEAILAFYGVYWLVIHFLFHLFAH